MRSCVAIAKCRHLVATIICFCLTMRMTRMTKVVHVVLKKMSVKWHK